MQISKPNADSNLEAFSSLAQPQKVADTQSVNLDSGHKITQKASSSSTQENKAEEDLKENLTQLSDRLNQQMQFLDTNIRFAINDELNRVYINVVEKDTNKIIKQIPTEEALNIAEYFSKAVGLLYDKES